MKRQAVVFLLGILFLAGMFGGVEVIVRPFERGARFKAMPASYWRKEVQAYCERGNSIPVRATLGFRLESYFGLRDGEGVPAVLGDDPKAIPVLLDLLQDNNFPVRLKAYYALKRLDKNALKAGLAKLFEGANVDDRIFAAKGTILVAWLERDSQFWRELVVQKAVPVLIETLTGPPSLDQAGSAMFLGYVGPDAKAAIPGLLGLLAGSNEKARREAAEALKKIDPEAIDTSDTK